MPEYGSGAAPGTRPDPAQPGGVVTSWVAQLCRPLIPTERRIATEARLVAAATGHAPWVACVLGGVVADLVAATPFDDPVRSLAARIGPLALAGPDGRPAPDVDGAAPGPAGLPVGFAPSDDTDEAMVAQEVFPVALPSGAAAVLAVAGAAAGRLGRGRTRSALLEPSAGTAPWRGVVDSLPVSDAASLLGRPWVAAAVGLALVARRGRLEAELSPIMDDLAGPAGDDAGRALAIAGTAALRWALWNRWRHLGDRWPADRLPMISARRWTDLAELAELAGPAMTLDEHWGSPTEFRVIAEG